jgi:Flp pilus assembly protein TadD
MNVRKTHRPPRRIAIPAVGVFVAILLAGLAGWSAEAQHGAGAGQAHYQQGLDAFSKGDWATAIRQLRWALEYLPKSPAVHNSLGLAYLHSGDADHAVIEFRKAIALKPDFAEAYYNMAQALERRDDEGGAVQFYQWAVRPGLPKAEAHDARGFLLMHHGDLAGAESEFEAAIKGEPSLASAHFHLGTAFRLQQKYPEAAAELKKALTLDPSNAKARYDLGLASRHLNQTKERHPPSRQKNRRPQNRRSALPLSSGFESAVFAQGLCRVNKLVSKALQSLNVLAHILKRHGGGMQESGSYATLTHQKFFSPGKLAGNSHGSVQRDIAQVFWQDHDAILIALEDPGQPSDRRARLPCRPKKL